MTWKTQIRSWSTGEYRQWSFGSRKEAFKALRGFKASYFHQLFYIADWNRRPHQYQIPACCTFEEFLANIGDHVEVVEVNGDSPEWITWRLR